MSNFSSQNPMKVLAILPVPPGLPQLAWINEIGQLSAVYGVKLDIVTGEDATIDRITHYLRDSKAYVVIWSGHGQPDGLLDSKGDFISGEALAAQLRPAEPYCTIVAACFSSARNNESLQSITEAISLTGIHSIGYATTVEDKLAIIYNRELLRGLVAGANITDANHMALRVLQHRTKDIPQIIVTPGLVNGYRMIMRRLDEHGRRLDNIEGILWEIDKKIK